MAEASRSANASTTDEHSDGASAPSDTKKTSEKSEDGEKDAKPKKPNSRWPLIVFGILVVVAVIAGLIYWLLTRNQISTDDAYTDGRAVMVAPQVSGLVTVLAINDNQFVRKGELLIAIDPRVYQASYDQAAGQVTATEAELANARVSLVKERTTAPAQLLSARGQLDEARAQLTRTVAEDRRQHAIERAATSQQNIDKATSDYQQAIGQVEQAEAQVKQAELVPQNIAQAEAQVAQLEGQLVQAKASLDQAAVNLGYTRVTAPQDGWITKRNVEVGDIAQVGVPVTAIVSPDLWVTANFKETQLNRMRPGQHVDIAVDSYPTLKLSGHVDSVQLGSGSRFTAFPAENATGNYIKIVQRVPVKIIIDSGLNPQLPLPLGLSVVPTVALQ